MTTKAKQDPPEDTTGEQEVLTPTEKLRKDIRANIGNLNKDLEHFQKLGDNLTYATLIQAKSNYYRALATLETVK